MRVWISITAIIVLAAGPAAAYPGPDGMGVYADLEATGPVALGCDLAPGETVRLYLCVTRPSEPFVQSWEAHVEIASTVGWSGDWVLMGDGINVGSGDDYVVGADLVPLTPNAHGVVALMRIDLSVASDAAPVEIFVRGIGGSPYFGDLPGYASDVGVTVPTVTSTGGADVPVFVVNGEAPLADETRAWGAVKRLYD